MKNLLLCYLVILLLCFSFFPIQSSAFETVQKAKNVKKATPKSPAAAAADSPTPLIPSKPHTNVLDYGDDDEELHIPLSMNTKRAATIPPFVHSVTIKIQHHLATGEDLKWSNRGEAVVEFGSAKSRGNIHVQPYELTKTEWNSLKELVRTNGYYRLRFQSNASAESDESKQIFSSIPACSLVSASFRELFSFHFDVNGFLLAVNPVLPLATCADITQLLKGIPSTPVTLEPKARTSFGRSADKPYPIRLPTTINQAVPQMNPDGDGGNQDQPQPENKGFLSTYWMYLIPLALILIVNALGQPPLEGQTTPAATTGRR